MKKGEEEGYWVNLDFREVALFLLYPFKILQKVNHFILFSSFYLKLCERIDAIIQCYFVSFTCMPFAKPSPLHSVSNFQNSLHNHIATILACF
ncbi:hypothetical protein Ahy_B06g084464 isoform G [Arachis hypogaea]|uniref:Uncharacterized protein n=1 Tax=Arachis hypogaea TaxID=3818 RepID=A0A444YRZ6_ARAHY|nr:hypothetical protein Ahy_B06g084464 isoform G [Arachis hypogaea]